MLGEISCPDLVAFFQVCRSSTDEGLPGGLSDHRRSSS